MMLSPVEYLNALTADGIDFFTGVPDSLLRDFCACVTHTLNENSHVIAANEGSAVGLALGYHLATNKIPLVYLQNSGLGNLINPVLSLASPDVYAVPMVLMIGWRGEPGIKDEPQHIHQGRVMFPMLDAMGIESFLLSDDMSEAINQTKDAICLARESSSPVAIVVSKGKFAPFGLGNQISDFSMSREEAIKVTASQLQESATVICTTGMASRELFEFRSTTRSGHHRDFLTVGGMGHASQIATGLAIADKTRNIYCFDGDGSFLMHMGSAAITGQSGCANLVHIVFNNGVHASVGGQPTVGFAIDIPKIALACGYASAVSVNAREHLITSLDNAVKELSGPAFIEVRTRPENRNDIGRPTSTPKENKQDLMRYLGSY